MEATDLKAIEWSKATIGGVEYTLRLSYAAHAQLFAWGFGGATNVPIAAWAAAMAGSFNKKGAWKSAGFTRWLDVADQLTEDEQQSLMDAVDEAIKKASPASTTTIMTEAAPAKDDTTAA